MSAIFSPDKSVSMPRICLTLAIVFGIFAVAIVLLVLLPFRSAGPVGLLRLVLYCVAFVFGVAWGALSLLAIPRSLFHLSRFRWPGTSVKTLLAGLAVLCLGCFPFAAGLAGFLILRMPDMHPITALPPLTAEQRLLCDTLRADVNMLAGTIGNRNVIARYNALCAAADAIERSLTEGGYQVRRQGYEIKGLKDRPCYNLEVEIRGAKFPDEIVVIGAHYDSEERTPGANDNASGVAALLAMARAFAGVHPERTLRFVAFVNEEPPFFWTRNMGSLIYARQCRAHNERIVAMISLETLGYYSDEPGSQRYPIPLLARIYPSTGNFVGFIGNLKSHALVRSAMQSFRRAALFPAVAACLPGWVTGVGWSDHWSFWRTGYPAIIVTDTALFRYRWYHTAEDTPEKLAYDRMALVVEGLKTVVADLAGAHGER